LPDALVDTLHPWAHPVSALLEDCFTSMVPFVAYGGLVTTYATHFQKI